jgi:hypothetical protein
MTRLSWLATCEGAVRRRLSQYRDWTAASTGLRKRDV